MSRVLTVKAVLWLIFSHLKNIIHVQLYMADKAIITCRWSRKTVLKSLAESVVQLGILFIYMRRINYDSAMFSKHFFSQRMNYHICLSYPQFFCCHFLFRCSRWISSHHLSVAWKPKTAPKHYVRLNDVNWNLVATSLLHVLGNSSYQTNRNMT